MQYIRSNVEIVNKKQGLCVVVYHEPHEKNSIHGMGRIN